MISMTSHSRPCLWCGKKMELFSWIFVQNTHLRPTTNRWLLKLTDPAAFPSLQPVHTIITASTADPFRRWQSAKSVLQPISNFLLGRGSPINHPRPIHTDILRSPLPHHLATTAQRTLPPFPYRARHDPGLCFDSPTPPPPIQTDKKKQETAP